MTPHAETVHALTVLTQHYANCQAALEAVAPQLMASDTLATAVVELTQILSTIDQHQQAYTHILQLWQSNGFVASPECRQAKQHAQAALESLLRSVQRIEEEAAASRARILPQLNSAARDQQARAAYRHASTYH
jgi:hypothetical protein